MTIGGEPKFSVPQRKRFTFESREPRFTNEENNLELKERIAQYADYVQRQIETHLNLDRGHFGDGVRYGMCPKGGIGMFEKQTTGGGGLHRLRGVYLEEEVIDERSQLGDELCFLYPPVIAHEMCHDFEYTQDRYDEYYASFQNTYVEDQFDYHLDELKIDKKSFGILRGVDLDFPGRDAVEKSQSLFRGYLLWNSIELERFEEYAKQGEIDEIVGENTDERLVLKFARSIARVRYVLENLNFANEDQRTKYTDDLAKYEQEAKRFLEDRNLYKDVEFTRTVDTFLEFLRREE